MQLKGSMQVWHAGRDQNSQKAALDNPFGHKASLGLILI